MNIVYVVVIDSKVLVRASLIFKPFLPQVFYHLQCEEAYVLQIQERPESRAK